MKFAWIAWCILMLINLNNLSLLLYCSVWSWIKTSSHVGAHIIDRVHSLMIYHPSLSMVKLHCITYWKANIAICFLLFRELLLKLRYTSRLKDYLTIYTLNILFSNFLWLLKSFFCRRAFLIQICEDIWLLTNCFAIVTKRIVSCTFVYYIILSLSIEELLLFGSMTFLFKILSVFIWTLTCWFVICWTLQFLHHFDWATDSVCIHTHVDA